METRGWTAFRTFPPEPHAEVQGARVTPAESHVAAHERGGGDEAEGEEEEK